MRLHRYLKEENIDLAFDPFEVEADPWEEFADEDGDVDLSALTERQRFRRKEAIIKGLVRLLEPGGKISNPKKCYLDLRNREAKATTGFGMGIAMPHVRTQQARDFVIGVAIAPEPGFWFDAVDDEPVRIFFPMIAPTHNDRFYRKVETALAEAFLHDEEEELRRSLLEAEDPGEVIWRLRDIIDQA